MIKIDRHTVIQVLGGLMHQPSLLSNLDEFVFEVNDFPNTLDKYVFSAINNLYNSGDGARVIRTIDIIKYLESNEAAKVLIEKENGEGFLQDCENNCEPANFSYYYERLKKLNFVRDLQKTGRNTNEIYCEDITDPRYTEINDRFDLMHIQDLVGLLRMEVNKFEKKYVLNGTIKQGRAADGIEDLLVNLQQKPDIGIKLQGDQFNTVCRGGRKGKLYIRSAASGVGKTRRMVGDACQIAYPVRFDRKYNKWVSTGACEKVLYIMTEQDTDEIQTMILAYLTGYNEDIFKYGIYGEAEMPRIKKAVEIMKKYSDNFLTAEVPEPCAATIKNMFRSYAIEEGVENIFFDYIFSCPALLNEYRDIGIREDVALRLFTTTLKNLAKELDIFVMTATQLTLTNEEVQKGGFRDERAVRGSKAIIDLADFACIMSRPTTDEISALSGFQKLFEFVPNLVTDIFKNRGGRWNRLRLWSYYDAGSLRVDDLFLTTPDLKAVEGFNVVNCETTFDEFTDYCNELNKGDNGVDTNVIENYDLSLQQPEELIQNAVEAFDNDEDIKRRVENKSFSELLGL